VQGEVGECACAFLGGGVCWLKDEGGLDGEKKAGGVKELVGVVRLAIRERTVGRGTGTYRVCREEYEFLREDGAPYYCCELRRG
jgi:hypothetical protein